MAVMGLPGLAAGAAAADKVTYAIPTAITQQYADLTFGITLGFFADEGIDLQLVSLSNTPTVPQVANKSLVFANSTADGQLQALAKGERIDVRFFYNYLRGSVYTFSVKDDSPIGTIADLKGKKLGIGALTWGNIPMSRAILAEAGIAWQKDITVVPIGVGPAAWRQLQTGQVDVMNYYISENEKMRTAGIAVRTLPYPDRYRHMFSSALVAHVDMIRDKPDLLARFGRAMAKLSVACKAAREACARSFWQVYPATRPTPDKEAEALALGVRLLDGNYQSIGFFPDGKEEWGSFKPDSWNIHVQVLADGGVLPRADLPVETLYTNQFVPEFNKFDRDAVIAKARAAEAKND
ncbi:hypothetical protein GCM10010994_10590 [Chelatococcus reniformis]|uniref:SsuA/THI5-like domain-containing protein n=1 Tax=Chelatococcus reniformis TaxID=1494448 RepID=A0A916X910_9HYPH|nr:hypothetical protein GCM10010994_10590 [Chelatococcus reniformis]